MLGSHLLGIYEKAFSESYDWQTRLKKAKAAGFDYMEISIDEKDSRIERLYWNTEQKKELRHVIEDAGIPLLSMCLSAHRRFPFGSADSALQSKAYEIMDRAIDFSLEIGIRTIQLAGYDVYYEPSTINSQQAFLDGLTYAAKKAEKNMVMLAMEIMDTPFYNSISKHLQYEQQIASPWFRVYPDLGNLTAWGNDVEAELRKGIHSIVAVHLKDTLAVTPTFEGKFKCVPFGSGCVDFQSDFRLLEELSYSGPYMIEMWAAESEDDVEKVLSAKRFIESKFA